MDSNTGKNQGTLYIVATPIGNLEDITLRAIRILKEVDLIAAEDTRHTRNLLDAYQIKTHLTSLHEHNEKEKSSSLIAGIKDGMSVAYVSDAGTPCISDPGRNLVDLAHIEKIRVIPIPGPCALIAGLSASGLSAENFLFCGFLPSRENKRRQFLESIKDETRTIIFYESPARFLSALKDLHDIVGNREIVVAREITKVFEDIKRGEIRQWMDGEILPKTKGEFTIILKGREKNIEMMSDEAIKDQLLALWENEELSLRDVVDQVVLQTGLSRKKVYDIALRLRE